MIINIKFNKKVFTPRVSLLSHFFLFLFHFVAVTGCHVETPGRLCHVDQNSQGNPEALRLSVNCGLCARGPEPFLSVIVMFPDNWDVASVVPFHSL